MTLLQPNRLNMSHDMRRIREGVLLMGERVEIAIVRSVRGLAERNVDLCAEVIRSDADLNRLQTEVRDLCFSVLLNEPPVAADLREVMGSFHMAAELERMGDHCVSIAKIARSLADLPPMHPPVDIPLLADRCATQVGQVLGAVVGRDVARARRVAASDDVIDRMYHRLFDDLVERMVDDNAQIYSATSLMFVAHHLERIGDRVTNLAEDLIFLETGAIEDLN